MLNVYLWKKKTHTQTRMVRLYIFDRLWQDWSSDPIHGDQAWYQIRWILYLKAATKTNFSHATILYVFLVRRVSSFWERKEKIKQSSRWKILMEILTNTNVPNPVDWEKYHRPNSLPPLPIIYWNFLYATWPVEIWLSCVFFLFLLR